MTPTELLDLMSGYQAACVIGAAAELDLYTPIADQALTAEALAARLEADLRGITILLDGLAALGVLDKTDGRYRVVPALRDALRSDRAGHMLPGLWQRMNVLRAWSSLAWTAKAGFPAPKPASIRGPAADLAAFVASMHTYSAPVADDLIARLGPPPFTHLLDVGGASGTWTLAFLRARPGTRATIFDFPHAIPQARQRMEAEGFADRVDFAAGDFDHDELPTGADLAWVSAIVHQNDRPANRGLFAKVHRALAPGGTLAIRDIVMDPDRTRPLAGALFAVNMLANTQKGTTFTFEELAEDLRLAGFVDPACPVRDEAMNSVVLARRV